MGVDVSRCFGRYDCRMGRVDNLDSRVSVRFMSRVPLVLTMLVIFVGL